MYIALVSTNHMLIICAPSKTSRQERNKQKNRKRQKDKYLKNKTEAITKSVLTIKKFYIYKQLLIKKRYFLQMSRSTFEKSGIISISHVCSCICILRTIDKSGNKLYYNNKNLIYWFILTLIPTSYIIALELLLFFLFANSIVYCCIRSYFTKSVLSVRLQRFVANI